MRAATQVALRCAAPLRRAARVAAAPCRIRGASTATAAPRAPPEPASVTLRPYQAENVAAILAALEAPCAPPTAAAAHPDAPSPPRLLYVLPTGGGKTVVLAAVMHAVVARGQRCLFLVHRQELVDQCVAQLGRRGVECGVIMARRVPRPREAIQVASVQTLSRRAETDFGHFDLLIIDEAHHAVAATYTAVAARWPDAALLGATATPFRLDGAGLRPPFQALLAGPSLLALTQAGYLVPATVRSDAAAVDTRGLKLDAFGVDYNIPALARRAGRITGDVVKEFQRATAAAGGARRRAIAYGVDVAHCKEMAAAFCAAGVRAEVVHGATNAIEREGIFERLRSGETQVLVNVNIATEGLDVPEVEAVLMVRPTLSRCLYLQMIGRGLRASPGKADCLILDHAGNVALHGLPTDAFTASLDGVPKVERPVEEESESSDEEAEGEAEEAREGAGRRRARFGDPNAQLQPLQKVALLRADTGEEVLPLEKVIRHGMRFPAPSYDVAISAPLKPGGKARAAAGGRAAFLDAPAWGPAWRVQLGELLATPRREAVASHAGALLRSLAAGKLSSAEWVAERLLEQWGADALRPLLDAAPSEVFNPLRASREGGIVRSVLRRRVGADGAPPQPPSRPTKAWRVSERVTLLVQTRD